MKILGSFSVGNKIQVCDPSYNFGDSGTLILENVFNGKYLATIEYEDDLISSIHICHKNFFNDILEFENIGFISVDSGQAGFFDFNLFIKNHGGTFDDSNSFYGSACAITSSPLQAGIINNFGVVSSSGFGDGCYNVFVAKNDDNKIIAAYISFISQEVS